MNLINFRSDETSTKTLRITGLQIHYLIICPRKLWLFSHHIEMEGESDSVAMGKLLHEQSFQRMKREVLIDDLIRVDFLDRSAVHDIKTAESMKDAHRAQILYYLWYLKQKGVKRKGVINYPKQKRSVEIELTSEAESEVLGWIRQVQNVVARQKPPVIEEPMGICSKCSYQELCWG